MNFEQIFIVPRGYIFGHNVTCLNNYYMDSKDALNVPPVYSSFLYTNINCCGQAATSRHLGIVVQCL